MYRYHFTNVQYSISVFVFSSLWDHVMEVRHETLLSHRISIGGVLALNFNLYSKYCTQYSKDVLTVIIVETSILTSTSVFTKSHSLLTSSGPVFTHYCKSSP